MADLHSIGSLVELDSRALAAGVFTPGHLYVVQDLDRATVTVLDDEGVAHRLPRAWVAPAAVLPVEDVGAVEPASMRSSTFASTPEDHARIAAEYLSGQRSSRGDFEHITLSYDSNDARAAGVIAVTQAVELVDMARATAHLAMADHLTRSPLSQWHRVRELAMAHARGVLDGMAPDVARAMRSVVDQAGIGGISVPDRFANYVADYDVANAESPADAIRRLWPEFVRYVTERAEGRL